MSTESEQMEVPPYGPPPCNMKGLHGCHARGWGFVINQQFYCSNHRAVIWTDRGDTIQFKVDVDAMTELCERPSADAEILKRWMLIRKFLNDEMFEVSTELPRLSRITEEDFDGKAN